MLESSESSICVYFSGRELSETNHNVSRFAKAAFHNKTDWITDIIPSFDTVVLCFDPLHKDNYDVYAWCSSLQDIHSSEIETQCHEIPVDYNATAEYDLNKMSQQLGLSVNDIVDLHCQSTLTVMAIGFAPHFAYLGELSAELKCPRKSTPRTAVPQGAVAIADRFSAVYPSVSPGGWNLLGCTTDPSLVSSLCLNIGDIVKFIPERVIR